MNTIEKERLFEKYITDSMYRFMKHFDIKGEPDDVRTFAMLLYIDVMEIPKQEEGHIFGEGIISNLDNKKLEEFLKG